MATALSFERFPADPVQLAELEAKLAAMVEAMRSAPGALWADVARVADDGANFVVVSEWRTAADLDAFQGSEKAQRLLDGCDLLLRADPTRRRFQAGP